MTETISRSTSTLPAFTTATKTLFYRLVMDNLIPFFVPREILFSHFGPEPVRVFH